jgi:hypothetical protein
MKGCDSGWEKRNFVMECRERGMACIRIGVGMFLVEYKLPNEIGEVWLLDVIGDVFWV